VTVLVLVLASSAAFGWSIWPLWLSQLPAHADWAATTKPQYMPTIVANLTFLGVDLPVARVIQLAVAAAVAGIIWTCFRPGPTQMGISALLVGTFLATPYAFVYDMPMVTNAVLAVLRDRGQTNRALTIPELIVLALSLVRDDILKSPGNRSQPSGGATAATLAKSCATGSRAKPRVMKTRRERRSSSGQSSSSIGG
jgi:hypothetical protein